MLKWLTSLFARLRTDAVETDPLLLALQQEFPLGPIKRGSFRGGRPHGDGANVIDEILLFDGGDHWLYLFLGCRALGHPFELSFRAAKLAGDGAPPQWPIEPVTRVANGIGGGAACALGATWRLGEDAIPSFAGAVMLRDLQFGTVEPIALWQLVPVTTAELALTGDELMALFGRLYGDRSRMLGIAVEHGSE
jgi:hypothetical protein